MDTRTNVVANVAEAACPAPEANPRTATTEEGHGPLSLVLIAVWFGLATGLLELVLAPLEWSYDPRTRLGYRLVNRHYLWMTPLGELVVFGASGLVLCLIARAWPRAGLRLATYLFCGFASLKLLLLIPELHKVTYFLLACGVASLAGPLVEARIRHDRPRLLPTIFWVVGTLAALASFSYGWWLLSEHRARLRIPAASSDAPNVLLVVMDTVRADALSIYGYDRDTSPKLAELARRGVRFDWATATAPWTLPSHASMFTGRLPHELGVGWFRPLDSGYPTLAEVLGARGYVTAGFVANQVFCHADYGLGRGFQHYEDIPVTFLEVLRSPQLGERFVKIIDVARYKLSQVLGDELLVRVFGDDPRVSLWRSRSKKNAAQINHDALAWISAQRGRPFFAFLNYIDAHDAYVPPRGADGHFGRKPSTPLERSTIRDWESITDSVTEKATLSPAMINLARDCYDDCVAYLDDQVGRLLSDLDARGLLGNTVVFITADHGEHFGEHAGSFGHNSTVYSQETRVPLLVIAPGRVPSGKIVASPVSLRDLPATVVDLVGLAREVSFPGRSLARFWEPGVAGGPAEADPVLAENEQAGLPSNVKDRYLQSLAMGDTVYIRNPKGDEELYNIAADPAQARNLAGSADSRSTLEHFRARLQQVLSRSID